MSTEPNPALLVVEVERSPPQLPTMNAAEERIANTDALLIVRNTVTSKICRRARGAVALSHYKPRARLVRAVNVRAGRTSAHRRPGRLSEDRRVTVRISEIASSRRTSRARAIGYAGAGACGMPNTSRKRGYRCFGRSTPCRPILKVTVVPSPHGHQRPNAPGPSASPPQSSCWDARNPPQLSLSARTPSGAPGRVSNDQAPGSASAKAARAAASPDIGNDEATHLNRRS